MISHIYINKSNTVSWQLSVKVSDIVMSVCQCVQVKFNIIIDL